MALSELACPTCGGDLRYIEEYRRHYCHECGNYAPEGFGGGEGLTCPRCSGVLSFIAEYDRYFCHRDHEYMPEGFGRELPSGEPTPVPLETPKEEPPSAPHSSDVLAPAPKSPEIADDFDEFLPPLAEPLPEEPRTTPPIVAVPPPVITTPALPAAPESAPAPSHAAPPPPLVRSELWKAKKQVLIDLCRAHGLEASGGREALRDRLLTKFDAIEKEKEKERAKAPVIVEPAAEVVKEPTEEPAPLASTATAIETPVERAVETVVELPLVAMQPEPRTAEETAASQSVPEAPAPVETRRAVEPTPTRRTPKVPAAAPVRVAEMVPVAEARPASTSSAGPGAVLEPARELPVLPEAPTVVNPCPTCGRELTYVKQYDRYYCMYCKAYAPPVVKVERIPTPPVLACPTCGRALTFIAQFNRHYCYRCEKYAPLAAATPRAEVRVEVPRVSNPCPTCTRPLRYIEQYDRWYCDSCSRYAPRRAKRPCPNCAGELTWVPRYRRYYCYACTRYAPATFPPPASPRPLAAGATPQVATATKIVTRRRQANASNAIGLAAMGVVMYVMYAVFAVFPNQLGIPSDLSLPPSMAFALQFIAVLFLAIGTVWGLWALNARK